MAEIGRREWLAGCAGMLALGIASPARAGDVNPVAGDYGHSEMELVAGLRLKPDGTFEYALTVGSLDERAAGRWHRMGDRVELISDPRPVPPTIVFERIDPAAGERFGLRVVAPNGSDVPGIDFVVAFGAGETLDAYTPGGRWVLPADERRVPRSVAFAMPSYRLRSGPIALEGQAGTTAVFLLNPNDFGVADLTGVPVTIEDGDLVMRRDDGTIRFRRTEQ